MVDMITRAEMEFRKKACLAQLKLRVVAFSIVLGVPPWIGFYALQKLGFNLGKMRGSCNERVRFDDDLDRSSFV